MEHRNREIQILINILLPLQLLKLKSYKLKHGNC